MKQWQTSVCDVSSLEGRLNDLESDGWKVSAMTQNKHIMTIVSFKYISDKSEDKVFYVIGGLLTLAIALGALMSYLNH